MAAAASLRGVLNETSPPKKSTSTLSVASTASASSTATLQAHPSGETSPRRKSKEHERDKEPKDKDSAVEHKSKDHSGWRSLFRIGSLKKSKRSDTTITVATPSSGNVSVTVRVEQDARAADIVQQACKQLGLPSEGYGLWSDETGGMLSNDTMYTSVLPTSVRVVLKSSHATRDERSGSGAVEKERNKNELKMEAVSPGKPEQHKINLEREFIFADMDEGKRPVSLLVTETHVKMCVLPNDSEARNFVKAHKPLELIENVEVHHTVQIVAGTIPEGPTAFSLKTKSSVYHFRANNYKEMMAFIAAVTYFQRRRKPTGSERDKAQKAAQKEAQTKADRDAASLAASSAASKEAADAREEAADARPAILRDMGVQISGAKQLREQLSDKAAQLSLLRNHMSNLEKAMKRMLNMLSDELDINKSTQETIIQTRAVVVTQMDILRGLHDDLDVIDTTLKQQFDQLQVLKNDLRRALVVESMFYWARRVSRVVAGLLLLWFLFSMLRPLFTFW